MRIPSVIIGSLDGLVWSKEACSEWVDILKLMADNEVDEDDKDDGGERGGEAGFLRFKDKVD
jgi:hypothetical protein